MVGFLSNRDIYTSVVCGIVPQGRERLWIATFARAEGVGLPDECNEELSQSESRKSPSGRRDFCADPVR